MEPFAIALSALAAGLSSLFLVLVASWARLLRTVRVGPIEIEFDTQPANEFDSPAALEGISDPIAREWIQRIDPDKRKLAIRMANYAEIAPLSLRDLAKLNDFVQHYQPEQQQPFTEP